MRKYTEREDEVDSGHRLTETIHGGSDWGRHLFGVMRLSLFEKSVDAAMDAGDGVILDALMKCRSVLEQHGHALVSISGGSDSDVMLDLVERTRGGVVR